jgi:hypothetical protein
MGKVLECGALASEPIAMDVMVGVIRRDHFDLVPGSYHRACTVTSVSAHSLYERENPIYQPGPGGAIDLTETSVEQLDARTVRVRGTTYVPSDTYTVKLEGVRQTGYRCISIAGVRCPALIQQIDSSLREAKRRTIAYFSDIGIGPEMYQVVFHVYGRDAVMQELEPLRSSVPHELGVLMEVVAKSQELAKAVCHHLSGALLHLDFPGQFNNAGNLAFPYSPSEINVGPVYEFSVYHLLRLDDPMEPFRVQMEHMSPRPREV